MHIDIGKYILEAKYPYLFDEIDSGLKIQPKIDKVPGDPLAAVFILFQHEHGVIE